MTSNIDNTSRYVSYSNYIYATRKVITLLYPEYESLAQSITTQPSYQKINRHPNVNTSRVSELLRNSWFTEYLICESLKYPDLLPYSNPWTMVHTYYSIYWEIHAYFLATNRNDAPDNHQGALSTLSIDLRDIKGRFPEPWCSVLDCDPTIKPLLLTNSTYPYPLSLTNPLTSPFYNDTWQYFILFLKTTRERKIQEKTTNWKQKYKKNRITKIERLSIVRSIPPTSIFDAIYRLRARSNYKDVDSFTFSKVTTGDARFLHENLYNILKYSLFVFEILIAKHIGKKYYESQVEEFLQSNHGKACCDTIGIRWAVMANFI